MGSEVKSWLRTVRDIAGWRAPLVTFLIVAGGLIEGTGLLLLVPLLQAAGLDVNQGAVAGLAAFVARTFERLDIPLSLMTALAVYVAVVAAQALLTEAQAILAADIQQRVTIGVRARLYRAIMRTGWVALSRERGSHLAHALTHEVDRIGLLTQQSLAFAAACLTTGVYIAFAFRVSPAMTMVVGACGAVLVALMSRRNAVGHEVAEGFTSASRALHSTALDHVAAVKSAKVFGVEAQWAAAFERVARDLAGVQLRAARHYARSQSLSTVGLVTLMASLVFVAITWLRLPPASLLLLVFLFVRVMPRVTAVQLGGHLIRQLLPAFESVQSLEQRLSARADRESRADAPLAFTREIAIENVSCRYDPEAPLVLDGVDLRISAGTTTAIVGPSGAGKSTVADVLLGLIEPDSGRVAVDGTTLDAGHMSAWRAQVAYVTQDAVLFHDTVRANLLWARPESTDQDMIRALELAAADDFVSRLPQKMDTVIGDRGVTLSGGERQRLALARALLRRPTLLVLDEPTNALDAENERQIWDAIERVRGTMAVLVISHQMSSVRRADSIYVMEGGKVVERGTWDALVERSGSHLRRLAAITA